MESRYEYSAHFPQFDEHEDIAEIPRASQRKNASESELELLSYSQSVNNRSTLRLSAVQTEKISTDSAQVRRWPSDPQPLVKDREIWWRDLCVNSAMIFTPVPFTVLAAVLISRNGKIVSVDDLKSLERCIKTVLCL